MKAGEDFKQTDWVVEKDNKLKKLTFSAGGKLVGYNFSSSAPIHWASVTVNVNIAAAPGQGFDWGYLSTSPRNIRIFKVRAPVVTLRQDVPDGTGRVPRRLVKIIHGTQ